MYELCACGVPTVMYALADNQLPGTEAFERSGIMLYAGDVRKNKLFAAALCDKLAVLSKDYPLREIMLERMRQTVDGNGAKRLLNSILGTREF